MPKLQLSAAAAMAAVCEPDKRKTVFWDTHIAGFVLEVRITGSKTYAFRYTDEAGRQNQHKIGRYGEISFEQARKRAERLRSDFVLGGNPAAAKAAKKAIPTYRDLAEQHLAYARTYQRAPGNTESVIRVHLLTRWGKLRLDEITSQAIAQWFAEKRAGGLAPATIEKIRITFNRSFELAQKWGIPGATVNPVKSVPRAKFNNARERYLTPVEAKRLMQAVEASPNPMLKHIVGLLLLTGARKSELLQAQWQHVDVDKRSWHIPISKTGKARHVPLSEAAMAIINALPRSGPWLLANPATGKPYDDIKRAWMTARHAAGLDDLHIHDLRHSAASFMINGGIDLYAVGRILGHADHQSTMRYSHLANDTLMKAVEAGAAGWL